jgi:diguanylate cyclase (GGDEF)-like protein
MSTLSSELLRIDPLTGCKNFLGFLETCLCLSSSDTPEDFPLETDHSQCSAVLFVDMNSLAFLNESKGRAYGDSVIHWMGILLGEESNSTVFRLGGDEFAVLINMDTHEEYDRFMKRVLERMDQESKLLGFPGSAADIALIVCDQSPVSLDTLLIQMGEAMVRVKNNESSTPMIFKASDFKVPEIIPHRWRWAGESDVSYTVRWLSYKSIFQVLEMGRSLDKTQEEAYTDAISNLPNMKAALLTMEQALQRAITDDSCFSILMIDGDNIRVYNSINYAAGDQMIRDMCTVFRNNLRPNDFVARWRSGDEFIVILPDTPGEGARIIGERFRLAVKEASQTWRFPVTISIGVASYPTHGDNIQSLIDQVEAANKRAKDQGKDQVIMDE